MDIINKICWGGLVLFLLALFLLPGSQTHIPKAAEHTVFEQICDCRGFKTYDTTFRSGGPVVLICQDGIRKDKPIVFNRKTMDEHLAAWELWCP